MVDEAELAFYRDGARLCCPLCSTSYPDTVQRRTLHKHANRSHGCKLQRLPKATPEDRLRLSRKAKRVRAATACGLASSAKPSMCNALLEDGLRHCKRKRMGTGLRARCFLHRPRTFADAVRYGGLGDPFVCVKKVARLGRGVFASVRFREHDVITVCENAGVNLQDKCVRERYRGYLMKMPRLPLFAGKQFRDLSPHMAYGCRLPRELL